MSHDLRRGKTGIAYSPCIHNMKLTLGKVSLVLVFSCFHKCMYSEPFLTASPQHTSLMLLDHETKCTCQVAPVLLNKSPYINKNNDKDNNVS